MKKAVESTKISNPIMKSKKQAKSRPKDLTESPWLEDYLDCFTFKMKPITQGFIDRISQELIQWAQNDPDAIKLSQFYTKKRIPRHSFYGWVKYPIFKDAKELTLEIIGARRELNTLKREYDASTNNQMMHIYDPEWKEHREYQDLKEKELIKLRAQLTKEAQNPSGVIYNIYKDGLKVESKKESDGR